MTKTKDKNAEKAHQLYSTGMSLKAVAANLGVSRSTVSRWLKSHGYQVRQGSEAHKRGTTIEQGVQEQIRRMNSQHIPLLEISASLQISYGRLHRFLSDEGLLWGRRIADVDLERLARLYDSGSTITDIADELNLDWKTVKSRLDKLGYSIRKADEYNRQGVDGLERQYKEMIADQNSLSTTAEKLGVSKYVLRQRIGGGGAELRPKPLEQEVKNLEKYPEFNSRFFAERGELSDYWCGFITADGSIRGNPGSKMSLTIYISAKDEGHCNKIQTLLRHGTIKEVDASKYATNF